jgi:hypothetical protein
MPLRRLADTLNPRPAMAAFRTAARKIERMIAAVEAGGDLSVSLHKAVMPVFAAIDRLELRVFGARRNIYLPEEAHAEAESIINTLRTRARASDEIGAVARQTARALEDRQSKEREYERRAVLSPAQREYEDELKLMRIR